MRSLPIRSSPCFISLVAWVGCIERNQVQLLDAGYRACQHLCVFDPVAQLAAATF